MPIQTIQLDANEINMLAMAGNYFEVIEGDPANFRFRGATEHIEQLDLSGGRGVRLEGDFHLVEILSTTSQQITVYYGRGRLVNNSASIELVKADTVANAAVSVGTSATLIKAANTSRKIITIQPLGGDIYVGGASVTVANGIKVLDGAAVDFSVTAALYGIAASATDTRYLEES